MTLYDGQVKYSRCKQHGVSANHVLSFPGNRALARNDDDFRSRKQKEHYNDPSPSEVVHTDMLNALRLEHMRADRLGPMRRPISLRHTVEMKKEVPVGSTSPCIADDRPSVMGHLAPVS